MISKKLISPHVEATYFNDDVMARHLDRIHYANVHQVFSELVAYFTAIRPANNVYCVYIPQENDELLITEGYG